MEKFGVLFFTLHFQLSTINYYLGVFAPLVRVQVFKTCGGCEQRSLSVRFRYTPVYKIDIRGEVIAMTLPGSNSFTALPVDGYASTSGVGMIYLLDTNLGITQLKDEPEKFTV